MVKRRGEAADGRCGAREGEPGNAWEGGNWGKATGELAEGSGPRRATGGSGMGSALHEPEPRPCALQHDEAPLKRATRRLPHP